MTKDMFGESLPLSSGRGGKDKIAKSIVESIFSDEVNFDNIDIEGELPKVCFLHVDQNEFILQTISSFQPSYSKFIHEYLYMEVSGFSDLELESFCSLPFRFFELDTKKYLVTETTLEVKGVQNIEKCTAFVKGLKSQLQLGLRSNFYARMVMEMKGGSPSGKTAYIQERIVGFIHRFPDVYDYDAIDLMNHFLNAFKEQFVKDRSTRSISQIILSFYLFSKKLGLKSKYRVGAGRNIFVKSLFLYVEELFGRKKTLGVMVTLSHLLENERLGKDHLLKAVKKFIRGASIEENSLFKISSEKGRGVCYYFEVEKKDGFISYKEKKELEEGLAKYLELHIQKLARKIFMPQNTEEVIKYTVALSKELRSVSDIPQVAVLFDSQTGDNLNFTVIILRPKQSGAISAFEIFGAGEDRRSLIKIKHVRLLGDFKECIELSYTLRVTSFMREDYSVDIYRARARVIADLQQRLGSVRDYNGGMLEKQGGQLTSLHAALRKKGVKNNVLVENFFYAIHPSEMRSIIGIDAFVLFFQNFYTLFSHGLSKETNLDCTEESVFFSVRVKSERKKESFLQTIKSLSANHSDVVYYSLRIQEKYYLGAYYRFNEEDEKRSFIKKMSICLKL